jgi:hypothetical protein
LFSEGQLRVLEESNLSFISLNEFFNHDEICDTMNTIRDKDTTTRRKYRYCERYRSLGKTMIDSINIVL